ncbi:MAG: amidohydrolase family protein [Deltaproteobacteria bacterium]|nr:amidohydrolase family protein [Deltaproteobacteria bacterium]
MHDLVIQGGTVVDGTGLPARTADVAIANGRIEALGRDLGPARRSLDADGLLVTPGWVDIHSHYDGQALWDPLLETSAAHGVTTVVMGNCGVGFAPVRPSERAFTIALMEGVEDIPAAVLEQGLAWNWQSFPEYLDALETSRHAIGVVAQVPHAALRVFVMGERGIDHAAVATDDEIARMGALAVEAIEAGAVGFTTSRSKNHVASDGRLTPSFSAGMPELLGIAAAIGRLGRGVFEFNLDNVDVEGDLALMRRVCEVGRRPLSVALLQRPGHPPDRYRRVLEGFAQAARDGLDLRGQVAPRPTGLLLSLGGRVNPLRPSPTYQALEKQAAARAEAERAATLRAALADADTRARILAELEGEADMVGRFPSVFDLVSPSELVLDPSRCLAARARATGVATRALVYDVLAAGRMVYVPVSNYVEGDLRATREMLVDPYTVPGLSDGGAHCTMIADFDYPTHLLRYWGRDAPEDQRIPLELLVKKQCADTASLVGLNDRGVLAPGRQADVNLVDLAAIGSTAPALVADLPGGGARLVGRGTGYVATLVKGELAFERGRHTGVFAGGLVRGGGRC